VFFGVNGETLDSTPIQSLVGEEATSLLGHIWNTAPEGVPGEPFLIRAQVQGQERVLMVQVTKITVEGEPLRLFTFMDAPPQGSVALAGWQENVIAMLDWLPFGFEIAGTDDQIQFANSTFNEMFGYSQDEIEDIEDWFRLAYPDPDYRAHARSMWETSLATARAENREMTPFDLDVMTKSGVTRTIQFRHRTIGNFNVNLYLDVTRESAYARELKVLAETDPLTGVINRRRFFEEAEGFYRRLGDLQSMAVLMLDIDNFKQINDAHGHGTGDLVLREFTERCRGSVRKGDLLARLGGEEFIILLAGTDVERARDIGERLRAQISTEPFCCSDVSIPVTVSIGGAMRRGDEESVGMTISRADRALYAAKRAGRDCLIFDTDDIPRRISFPGYT
jgi:diguanylate cyclase (GGDEF)-like protein